MQGQQWHPLSYTGVTSNHCIPCKNYNIPVMLSVAVAKLALTGFKKYF